MYQLVYYVKRTESLSSKEQKYNKYKSGDSAKFRLRKNALHYVREIVQSYYREEGFGTEEIVGGINCYKSEKTAQGDRQITEITVKVEKVGQ